MTNNIGWRLVRRAHAGAEHIYTEIEDVTPELVAKVQDGKAIACVHTKRMRYTTGHMVARRTTRHYEYKDGKFINYDTHEIQMHDGNGWKDLTNELAKLFDPDTYNKRMERKAENKRKSEEHGCKVGDIFRSAWGYEQTNVEFYEVVKTTPCTVTVREIYGKTTDTGTWCSGHKVPVPGAYVDGYSHIEDNSKGKVCRVSQYGTIKINDVITARKWNGKPVSYSWGY